MTDRWLGAGEGWLACAHATGFCKEVWTPLVADLREAGEQRSVIAWDAPGHGDTEPLDLPVDWWDIAKHGLEVVADLAGPIVGVGPSMGGATLAMAELLEPGTFAGLVLIEPVIFPPPFERADDFPLVGRAQRRRDGFAGIDEALEHYAQPFAGWDHRVLDAYVRGGLREGDGRWWLKCRPEIEAETYRGATAHGLYSRLGELDLPVLVLGGEQSTTFTPEYIAHIAGLIPGAGHEVLSNVSHFLPMERPDLLAERVRSFPSP